MTDPALETTDTPELLAEADVVVGLIPPAPGHAMLEAAISRIVATTPPVRAVLVHPPFSSAEALHPSSAWRTLSSTQLAQDPAALVQSIAQSVRAVADIARRLGASACAVVASDLSTVTPEWIDLLLQPIVEEGFDLVAPCYARHAYEGMINRAIVYPLFRALYGRSLRNPLGPDFGISAALLTRLAAAPGQRVHALASLAAEASLNGMKVCQSHLGPRLYATPDWTGLGGILAQVLGPLFLDMERYASSWQRVRGSQPVPEFGHPSWSPASENTADVSRLIESFQLGARSLPAVWSLILPPSTLVELNTLSRQDAAAFRLPDETWARVVYDFAVAHRVRVISRDQMLRAIAPIYLGWVASYTIGLESLAPDAVEQRLEKLCQAFEAAKSYLVSRWRWPDRFNP